MATGKTRMRITVWNGDAIASQVRSAEVKAVQETIDAAAEQAKASRTGRHSNITSRVAHRTPTGVRGRWGVFPAPRGKPFHELFRETGTAFLPGDNAKRRAADAEYPHLASRIRRHLDA